MTSFLAVLMLGITTVRAQGNPLLLLFENTWGGTDSEVDQRVAVAPAPDSRVYLAGETRSFGVNPVNIFLLQYDADGPLLWQRTWSGPGQFSNDEVGGTAVAPDGTAVYVTGMTLGTGGDMVLLKFDSSGTLLWDRTWGGAGLERGEGVAVATDGSVYVVGGTQRSFRADANDPGDLFIVKFAPDGTLVWQQI
jgi:hypothetical protein